MADIEYLVERSGELKGEVLAFAQQVRFERELRAQLRSRFGEVVVGDEEELVNFFDWFLLQYRRRNGDTIVDCFLRERPDLPDAEREFVLGWREVVEGAFEVIGHDGPALNTINVIDDLRYRIRSNMGPDFFEPLQPGGFLVARVVPIGDQWLLSGSQGLFGAEQREDVLRAAVRTAVAAPEAVFRNPALLARGWELQQEDRAAFIAHVGSDSVTVPVARLSARLGELAASGSDRLAGAVESIERWARELPLETDTVGLVFGEQDGLSAYPDFGAVEDAFADPQLVRGRRHRRLLKNYLADDTVGPVVFERLARRHPERVDRVFRLLLGKPGFRWARDGQVLMRAHKPWAFDRPPRPRTVVLNDRLAPYARQESGAA